MREFDLQIDDFMIDCSSRKLSNKTTSKMIKQEQSTISNIQCTLLEYVTGQYTEHIYIIPHKAGAIYIGVTFPTGEPIQEFNNIIESITMN